MIANEGRVADCVEFAEAASDQAPVPASRIGDDVRAARDRTLDDSQASDMGKELPLLTVIVPVYNEAPTVGELLRQVTGVPVGKHIIVVDDGSTDGTADILDSWHSQRIVEVLRHDRNRGKGAAIRTGLEHAGGRFTIIQDADLEYHPEDYARLLEPLLSGRADVVYGSRYLRRQPGQRRNWGVFRAGVSVLNLAVWLLYGQRLTDEATCYKAFATELLKSMDLRCERFEFCPEVTAKACRLGLRIHEVPIHYDARSVQQGKKIRWTDGLKALACLWRWRRWKPEGGTVEG